MKDFRVLQIVWTLSDDRNFIFEAPVETSSKNNAIYRNREIVEKGLKAIKVNARLRKATAE